VITRLLTIEDVARRLNVSTSTVRRWVASRKLPGHKAGAQWRFEADTVDALFRQGVLAAANPAPDPKPSVGLDPTLVLWKRILEQHLADWEPEHVVVNDRRGAKVWDLLGVRSFTWGRNLWHSLATGLMTPADVKAHFGGCRVLLFDEMMQHGEEMHRLRARLESAKAQVSSFVCMRSRSHALSGKLKEYQALYCEDLSDREFSERAALISRVLSAAAPPLDVDHLVLRGRFSSDRTDEEISMALSRWGMPFVAWHPGKENAFRALTLDRPQFINTAAVAGKYDLTFRWDGPCKLRFYVEPESRAAHCSFVVYPRLSGPAQAWGKVLPDDVRPALYSASLDDRRHAVRLAYWMVCLDLAVQALRDVLSSGAAHEAGFHFDNLGDTADHMRATFGPALGSQLASDVRQALTVVRQTALFGDIGPPPPLFVRSGSDPSASDPSASGVDHDFFACRNRFFELVPRRYTEQGEASNEPIAYRELMEGLPAYDEFMVSQVLDRELDQGTTSPRVVVDLTGSEHAAWRGFCRGEFSVWSEADAGPKTHADQAIERTLLVAPAVVDTFIRLTGGPSDASGVQYMVNTDFDKVFVNLQHDLPPNQRDVLFMSWMPYRFGAVPILPVPATGGAPRRLERFLTENGVLTEWTCGRQSRYRAAQGWGANWRDRKDIVDPHLMLTVSGLVKVYARIKRDIPGGLIALASARDRRTAYTCGWYHVQDWLEAGEVLFPFLRTFAETPTALAAVPPTRGTGSLTSRLHRLAEPGALLEQKLKMYRQLPAMRRKMQEWAQPDDELSLAAEAVLARMDAEASFESGVLSSRGTDRDYPIHNLAMACAAMRNFTSMTRQLLTQCGLERDPRPGSASGAAKNAPAFTSGLLSSWPHLAPHLEEPLSRCLDIANEGALTRELADLLARAFTFIAQSLRDGDLLPDPRPQAEVGRIREQTNLRVARTHRAARAVQTDQLLQRLLSQLVTRADPSYIAVANVVAPEVSPDVEAGAMAEELAGEFDGLTVDTGAVAIGFLLLSHDDPDLLLAAARYLLDTLEARFRRHGLGNQSRCAIAYRDPNLTGGSDWSGIRPGMVAHDLAFRQGLPLGALVVTGEVKTRLQRANDVVTYEAVRHTTVQGGAFIVHHTGWDRYLQDGED
jgi:excisionase family DNA binding protein